MAAGYLTMNASPSTESSSRPFGLIAGVILLAGGALVLLLLLLSLVVAILMAVF